MRVALLLIAFAAMSRQTEFAQAPRQPTFKAEVKLVRLLVNVKNSAGELIGSVDKSEFTVFDSGVPQEISNFERYTTKPISVAVMADTSGSAAKDWQSEVRSIRKFLNALFREGNERDAAAMFTFNYDITMRSRDFTRNAKELEDSLKYIKPEGGTSLYDAIYHTSQQLQRRGEGRRVIVLVSDGGNTTSARAYKDAKEAAQRADVVMYPIVVVPIENDAGRNTGGEHALQTLAADTGGRWFDPTIDQLDQTFLEILRDLRAQYMLGYYPKNLPADAPKFHPVRVEIARKDLRAQTRTGYYGDDSH